MQRRILHKTKNYSNKARSLFDCMIPKRITLFLVILFLLTTVCVIYGQNQQQYGSSLLLHSNDKFSMKSLKPNFNVWSNEDNSKASNSAQSDTGSETRENVGIDKTLVQESNIILEKTNDKEYVANTDAKVENSELQPRSYEASNPKGQQSIDQNNQSKQENSNEQAFNEENAELKDNTQIVKDQQTPKNKDQAKAQEQPTSKTNNEDKSSTILDIASSYGLFIAAGCISISVMGVLIYLYITRRKAIRAGRLRYRLVSNLDDESFNNEPIDMDI